MSKQYSSDQALHDKIMHGVNTLADNVAATLGPRGRNVILHQKGKQPIVTKDGVTVAKFVDLDDPVENVGAQIIKEAASQTTQSLETALQPQLCCPGQFYRRPRSTLLPALLPLS